ncbi:MAG: hypothetical protein IPP88_09870 [Betaproteobacteria bacterium]|nr:hypothetical protein [Betaproteobacteria bacterium]
MHASAGPAGGEDQLALHFMRDAETRTQARDSVVRQLFSLNPAENALAIEPANGYSLEEAAETLGPNRNTVRAVCARLFQDLCAPTVEPGAYRAE